MSDMKLKRGVADYAICGLAALFICAYLSVGFQPVEQSEPAPEPAQREAPARAARPSAPVADYPVDFAREVYCPGDLLVALTHLLPYGADVLGILSAYFDIAKLAGTIEGGRTRATFPVGYIRDGERHEVGVTIKKKRTGKAAAGCQTWAIAAVEHDAE